jgi:hypothetical protein
MKFRLEIRPPGLNAHMTPSDSRHGRRLRDVATTLALDGPPPITRTTPGPLPRRIERVRVSIASPLIQASRVGIRIVTFGACSGFTHVTARRIAQPPRAAFVTRLQPCRLPGRTARQLPDQSTTLRVESSPPVIRAFGAYYHEQTDALFDQLRRRRSTASSAQRKLRLFVRRGAGRAAHWPL